MATLTIMGSGVSNGNMVETYMPYATYKSAAVVSVETGSDVGICSSSKTIMWDKSAIPTKDSGWYVFTTKQDLWIDLSADTVVVTTRDPAAPPGDHNTLIDGTAYEIDGGKVLVGGTAYSIDKGKTMVGGTVYEIAFGVEMVTVNISKASSSDGNYTYVSIDGVKYSGKSAATIEVPVGTKMICQASTSMTIGSGSIKVDGKTVASGRPATYTYTINTPITVTIAYGTRSSTLTITTS